MPLIELEKVSKIYPGPTRALKKISLTVEKGEFIAIMGPSGSGKSTLLHILGLLDTPTAGQYFLTDKAVTTFAPEDLARLRNAKMGFVFQAFNLLPRLTVFENVKLPLLYSNAAEREWAERARSAIAAVGMAHRLYYQPAQLSGGEKQRVAIARALMTDPELILADEPTGNLDTKTGQAIMAILARLNKEENRTILLVTHERDIAAYARRVINLRDGEIERDVKQ